MDSTAFDEQLLDKTIASLQLHGFQTLLVSTPEEAGQAIDTLADQIQPASIGYGDSMSLRSTGSLARLAARPGVTFYDGFQSNMPRPQKWEIRRQAMTADLFLTGINAISADGSLYWVDMVGNRIAPIAFGPRHVILVAGTNKIVKSPADARARLRKIAPLNAQRHPGFQTPCMADGKCKDCNSPDRLCNAWLTLTRCYPQGRITVIIFRQSAGL